MTLSSFPLHSPVQTLELQGLSTDSESRRKHEKVLVFATFSGEHHQQWLKESRGSAQLWICRCTLKTTFLHEKIMSSSQPLMHSLLLVPKFTVDLLQCMLYLQFQH